jgi:hypothetical protein
MLVLWSQDLMFAGPGEVSTWAISSALLSPAWAAALLQGFEMFKGSAFSTTETFTTTHGFAISTPPASCSAHAAERLRSSSSCSDNSSAVEQNNVQPPDKPSTPVGWSGLLEISRCACQGH